MKFYFREKELELLEKLNQNRPTFTVIYGKRRVGKTELIKQFSKNKKTFYIYVDNNKPEEELLKEYTKLLNEEILNDEFNINFKNFKDFLKFILKQNIIIVFDEFQRFIKINPSIINYFQEILDLQENKANLIVSGSAYGMIKKIFIENEAPLFKRADLNLKLKDFSFNEIKIILKDLGIKDIEEQIKIYSIFGGSIFYYNLIEKFNCKSYNDILENLFLNEISPLKYEVKEWFIEQFGKLNKTYFQILYAISKGKNTKKEISDYTQIKETSLHPYLEDLIELLGVIEFVLPITEKENSKKGRYVLNHNFFKFWFRFIYENENLYQIKDFIKLKEKINLNFNDYLGFIFENLVKEYLIKENSNLPFKFENCSNWWNKKGLEIDLIGINSKEKKIFFCECKYKNEKTGVEVLNNLKEKSKAVNWLNHNRKEYFYLFSKNGFTQDLIKVSKKNENIKLFNLMDF